MIINTWLIVLIVFLAISVGFGIGFWVCYSKYKKEITSYGEYEKIINLISDDADKHKLSIKVVDDKNDNDPSNDDIEIHIDPIK